MPSILYNGKKYSADIVSKDFNVITADKYYSAVPVVDLSSYLKIKNVVAGSGVTINYSTTGVTINSTSTGGVSNAKFNSYTGTTAPATYQSKASIITLTGTTLPAAYQSKASIAILTGSTLPAAYASKSVFNTYTGTTAPATYQSKTSIVTLTGTTLPATYASKSVFNTYTGTTAPSTYLKISNFNQYSGTTLTNINSRLLTSAFNTYSGTTVPATYALKSRFNTYTGTTAPATYQSKASIITLTGTTLPATYALKSIFNTYTGSTNTRVSLIENKYITGATNGLSISGKNVKLGGVLTGTTVISYINKTGNKKEYQDLVFGSTGRTVGFTGGTIPIVRFYRYLPTIISGATALIATYSATVHVDQVIAGSNASLGNKYTNLQSGNFALIAQGGVSVYDNAYGGKGFFYQSASNTTVIGGGASGENIQFGSSNRIFNSAETWIGTSGNAILQAGTVRGASGGYGNSLIILAQNQTPATGQIGIGVSVQGSTANSGSGIYKSLEVAPTINLNAAASGATVIGIDFNPTLTNTTGGTMYGIISRPTKFLSGIGGGSILPSATWQINGFGTNPTLKTIAAGTTTNYSIRSFQSDGVTEIFSLLDNGTATHTGNLKLGVAGNGLYIKEGSNATMGVKTLTGGTAVVSTTKVTSLSRIQLTSQGGGTNHGTPYVSTRSAGTSFTITSTNASDTDSIAWFIIEPA